MLSLLLRAMTSLRGWLGLNDPSANRLHPSHGWLLPDPARVRAPVAARVRFEGGR